MAEDEKLSIKREFNLIAEEEEKELKEISETLDRKVDELTNAILSHLLSLGEKQKYGFSRKKEEKWRNIIKDYLRSLFMDTIDKGYLDKRYHLGKEIYKQGVAIEAFMGIYSPIFKPLLNIIFDIYQGNESKISQSLCALMKRINLDIQIVVETYMSLIGEEITKASEDLKSMVKTISKIAGQTKLIALNAAIEAARAGTSGKTFAVVAQEISKLAASSARAAEEADEMIKKHLESFAKGWD